MKLYLVHWVHHRSRALRWSLTPQPHHYRLYLSPTTMFRRAITTWANPHMLRRKPHVKKTCVQLVDTFVDNVHIHGRDRIESVTIMYVELLLPILYLIINRSEPHKSRSDRRKHVTAGVDRSRPTSIDGRSHGENHGQYDAIAHIPYPSDHPSLEEIVRFDLDMALV